MPGWTGWVSVSGLANVIMATFTTRRQAASKLSIGGSGIMRGQATPVARCVRMT